MTKFFRWKTILRIIFIPIGIILWLIGWLLITANSYESTQEITQKQTVLFKKLVKENDQEYSEGTTDFMLTWNFFDKYAGTYEIYKDASLYSSGGWNQNSSVSINIGNSPEGIFTYTLVVTDFSGNIATDTVTVTVNSNESDTETTDPQNPSSTTNPASPSSNPTTTLPTTSPGFEILIIL